MQPRSTLPLRAYPDTVEVPGLRGLGAVPDEALLATVLAMADPGAESDALALRLLAGGRPLGDAVAAIVQGSANSLSPGTALRLSALVELAARLVRPALVRHPVFVERDSLVTYCRLRATCVPVEMVRLLFLDGEKRLIADEVHQSGTVNQVGVYVREMMRRALEVGARGLVVAHSAPRDAPPNPCDAKLVCADVRRAGSVLGIDLHAYLLIGQQSYRCLVQEQDEGSTRRARTAARGGEKAGRAS